ncbi:hypothetical protein BU17DRAFT_86086 [Hysterangium stoloniferum]|nr:hypothetical protein BU17DRAFT_86086 [Hysterangium stoloniferum]
MFANGETAKKAILIMFLNGYTRVAVVAFVASRVPSIASPYVRRSPHNHTAICALDADSHNSGSQDHNPPTPTPAFQTQPNLSRLRSGSLHDCNTVGHMAVPTLDPRDLLLYSEDYEESPTVSHESAPALSPLGMYSHPQGIDTRVLISSPQTNLTVSSSHAMTSRADPLARHPYHVRDVFHHDFGAASGSQPLQWSLPFTSHQTRPRAVHEPPTSSSSHPPQTNPTASSHPMTSSADPLAHHSYHVRDIFHHDGGAASGSQPLQQNLPFISHQTQPQAVYEPPKVTLPSFAEAFPEFVGSSLSNL